MSKPTADIVIVGAGNAALCAAIAAAEQGIDSIVILESAPVEQSGGNSRFTAGAFRCAYGGVDDLVNLMPDITQQEIDQTDFGSYTEEQFFDDMGRITHYRCDADLTETLITNSYQTLSWMQSNGIRFQPMWGRQAFKVDGKFKFWGGLTVESWGGGEGLVDGLTEIANNMGCSIQYNARATSLIESNGVVIGINYQQQNCNKSIATKAVVLASGGFEANTAHRAQYLGKNWDLAKVRGSCYNMGAGIDMALDIGASPYGHWSGCHAVGWDANAPEFGDLSVGDGFQKHSYPFSIMLNSDGLRFVDEGADFRNFTYAKYGAEILAQPNQVAWQIFDQQTLHLQRDEYRIRQVSKVTANSLPELLAKCEGINTEQALKTIQDYNDAVDTNIEFNPNIKDGLATKGLKLPKSNWANKIEQGPFEAYAITCGVTFTFGGLRIDDHANVLSHNMQPIKGLYAAGELVGGLFYHNYPGGTGLMSGSVFGRLAGTSAASFIKNH